MQKIRNFLASLFLGKPKEFVLTRSKPDKKNSLPGLSKEQMVLDGIEALFNASLAKFPPFTNAGVLLDSKFDNVGYVAHAAFTTPKSSDPIFVSVEIHDLDDCVTKEFVRSLCERFETKMKEASQQ